ncbi:hypothetical protein ACOSP7_000742 [Xanthoceras sorbifolium]
MHVPSSVDVTHAPSLVDVPPAVTNPGMVFRVGSIFSSPNCAQGAVVSQSEGAPCISSSPKHSLVMVTAQDKGKEVVFSSKNDRTTVLPMDTIPPARKLSWKRCAHTSNDSRLIEMKDLPSLKRAASFKDDIPFPGQVRWGHCFKFESYWADMDPCRDIIKRSWAGTATNPLRLAVPLKLQSCASALDAWNRSSLQQLRREIARTRGRIRVLGQVVSASSWRELRLQESKISSFVKMRSTGSSRLALRGWPAAIKIRNIFTLNRINGGSVIRF